MLGECEICGNHTIECDCAYKRCAECEGIIFRGDKVCINCLLKQSKKLIEDCENNFKDW